MRPFTSTLPLADARAILREAARPIERTEPVALEAMAGRVLAADVVAAADVPPFDRAAMDGYAVRAADTRGAGHDHPVLLSRAGAVFTGQAPSITVREGECVEIATGAPLPAGADAVVMVEDTTRVEDGRVAVRVEARPWQHLGRRAGDIERGQTVLLRGALMTPARVGALAAVGQVFAEVFERPRVALISTGDEIVEPGLPLAPGRIHDVNRFTLPPLVRAHGGRPESRPAVADSREALRDALDAAGGADLVVFSGASSVGERDLLIDVVGERGQVLFHGIRVKPGKPTLLARVGEQLVLGMPGNPTSCLSNAYILLVPLLRAIARLPEHVAETRELRLSEDISSPRGRHQFYPVRVDGEAAVPVFKGSGEITSLSQADGYIEVPAETERVSAGTVVTVKLF